MNQQDVLDRLQEELNIPFFDGKIEDKEYSEGISETQSRFTRTTLNNMYRM